MIKNDPRKNQLESAILAGLKEGTVAVPHLLLKYYQRLKLTELDAMLLIHLIGFIDKEKNDFPTIDEIQARMSALQEHVISTLQKLLKEQMITIDESIDAASGIQYERYNLDPLYGKLIGCFVQDLQLEEQKRQLAELEGKAEDGKDLFSIFENEFARPLTPMEFETISGWIDQDRYKGELILAALKEAVFAGKVHFRYIDRILLDWSRNRVQTIEQAKEYTQKFRNTR